MTRRRWCTANHAPERRGAHKFAEIRERRREREKVFWLPSSALKNKKKASQMMIDIFLRLLFGLTGNIQVLLCFLNYWYCRLYSYFLSGQEVFF